MFDVIRHIFSIPLQNQRNSKGENSQYRKYDTSYHRAYTVTAKKGTTEPTQSLPRRVPPSLHSHCQEGYHRAYTVTAKKGTTEPTQSLPRRVPPSLHSHCQEGYHRAYTVTAKKGTTEPTQSLPRRVPPSLHSHCQEGYHRAYTVTAKKGTMVTARRGDHEISRNTNSKHIVLQASAYTSTSPA